MATALFICCGCASPAAIQPSTTVIEGCPNRPNCVSTYHLNRYPESIGSSKTTTANQKQKITAPELLMAAPEAWLLITEIITALPRTTIIEQRTHYLHAECKSRWFGFVDDLEIQLIPSSSQLQIRSASRVGYADFGVNHQRVEKIITQLKSQLIVK